MKADKKCEHQFQAILFCPKCQSRYDIGMVEVIRQAKIDSVSQVVRAIKKKVDSNKNIDDAISESIDEFEKDLQNNEMEVMIMGLENND